MGMPKLWGKDKDGNRGFLFSHVKTIYYNWASKILLSTKLDEMDALIEAKVAKAMMSNQQVNATDKVPTSALAYAMSQNITKNTNDIADINGSSFISTHKYISNADIENVEDLYNLSQGIYLCGVEDTTYLPYRWGTLNIFQTGGDYGCVTFYTTAGTSFFRTFSHSNTNHWYTDWVSFATKGDLNKEIKTVIVSPNFTYRLYVIHSGFALWFHGSANTQYHIYGITGQTAFPIMEGTDTGGITFSRVNQNAYNVTTETSYELYMMLLGDFTFEKIG